MHYPSGFIESQTLAQCSDSLRDTPFLPDEGQKDDSNPRALSTWKVEPHSSGSLTVAVFEMI